MLPNYDSVLITGCKATRTRKLTPAQRQATVLLRALLVLTRQHTTR